MERNDDKCGVAERGDPRQKVTQAASRVRVVLFDIDGTLIQSGGAGMKAFERTASSAFNAPNGTKTLQFAGRTDRSIVRGFFEANRIQPHAANFQRFFDHYVFWLDHLLPRLSGRRVPGITRLMTNLRALSEPPLLGLLTGNIRLGAEIKLRHFGLWEPFQLGAFGDNHEDRDTLAEIAYQRSCERLNRQLHGNEILVIGDTLLDIQCARKIEARVLAIASGAFSLEQLRAANPDWAVEDPGHLWVNELCQ